MKILMINHFPLAGSGSGIYTANIAKSLVKKGHEVCVIMPEVRENFERIDGVKMHPVYFKKDAKIDGQLPFNFPCFTTHPFSTNNFEKLTLDEEMMYRDAFRSAIEEEIQTFEPDVIHGQHIWVLSRIASEYELPLVVTAHGTDLIGYQTSNRYHSDMYKTVEKASKIIAISNDNASLVKKLFPGAEEKVVQIKNGYDDTVFYPCDYNKKEVLKELGVEKEYPYVVSFAGKLTYIKGVDLLLRAAKEYETEDVLTLISGNGELFNVLQEKAQNLGLHHVKFLGNQSHDMLRKIYNIANVSLVPSRSEAFGLVAIEALACGTPVIASNQGGLPSIVTEEFGKIFPIEDTHTFASLIQEVLYQNPYSKEKIASQIKSFYSQDHLLDEVIQVYETVQKQKTR